jgi:cell division protein FtsX
MIPPRLAAWVGTKTAKAVLVLIVMFALATVACLAAMNTASIIDGWISNAATAAEITERLKWQAAIAKSNAEVAEAKAQRATAVAALEAGAGAEIATLRQQLTSLEAQNAALPGADRCGVGRDRVRLLR